MYPDKRDLTSRPGPIIVQLHGAPDLAVAGPEVHNASICVQNGRTQTAQNHVAVTSTNES